MEEAAVLMTEPGIPADSAKSVCVFIFSNSNANVCSSITSVALLYLLLFYVYIMALFKS